jgi:hypothetical protein
VAKLGTWSATELAAGIMASLEAFTGGRAQKDEVTLVVVKWKVEGTGEKISYFVKNSQDISSVNQ